jgi:putative transposase
LKKAIAESVSGATWQCHRSLPRKRDDDCLQDLRWLYDRRQLKEAMTDIKA